MTKIDCGADMLSFKKFCKLKESTSKKSKKLRNKKSGNIVNGVNNDYSATNIPDTEKHTGIQSSVANINYGYDFLHTSAIQF